MLVDFVASHSFYVPSLEELNIQFSNQGDRKNMEWERFDYSSVEQECLSAGLAFKFVFIELDQM